MHTPLQFVKHMPTWLKITLFIILLLTVFTSEEAAHYAIWGFFISVIVGIDTFFRYRLWSKYPGIRRRGAAITLIILTPIMMIAVAGASASESQTETVADVDIPPKTAKADPPKKKPKKKEEKPKEKPKPAKAKQAPAAPAIEGDRATVTRIVDGDTIHTNLGKIRFIGLDTPETKDPRKPVQCFGHEASNKMTELVSGKTVILARDPTQGDVDKYNRLLRYVYLEDGTDVAKAMIEQGYGHEYTYRIPYQKQAEYKQAQSHATNNGLGLWAASTCGGNTDQSHETQPAPAPAPAPASDGDAYYPNCAAARAAGVAPIMQGQPGYRPALDRDRDGVACE